MSQDRLPAPATDRLVIYVFRCDRFFKIGITRDIRIRLRSMQTSCPLPIAVVMWRTKADELARYWERVAHNHLADYWHTGEWFDVDEATIRAAMRHAELETQREERRRIADPNRFSLPRKVGTRRGLPT